MRFTELGSVLMAFLDNNNLVRYHLLHISFLLTKDSFIILRSISPAPWIFFREETDEE